MIGRAIGTANRQGVHVFAHVADFAFLYFPDVYPLGTGKFAGGFYAHCEMPQDNHLLALCNKLFRRELNDVLHFYHSTEELFNLFTPLPSSGKWHVRDVGHDPENVFRKYVQERRDIARIHALICLLYQFGVPFFVQVFPLSRRGRDLEFKSSGLLALDSGLTGKWLLAYYRS